MDITRFFIKAFFAATVFLLIAGSFYPLCAQQQPQPAEADGEKASAEKKVPEVSETARKEASGTKNEAEKIPVTIKDADYWYERGVLFSVYGNDKSAIQAFSKAAKLAPGWSQPHFQMGVSYGESGRYEEAIKAIDKAIELDAEKGEYYYGRGRVYLMSGDRIRAMEDFEKAADMGNRDAKKFIEKQLP